MATGERTFREQLERRSHTTHELSDKALLRMFPACTGVLLAFVLDSWPGFISPGVFRQQGFPA